MKTSIIAAAIALSVSSFAMAAPASDWQPGFNPNPSIEAPNGGGIDRPDHGMDGKPVVPERPTAQPELDGDFDHNPSDIERPRPPSMEDKFDDIHTGIQQNSNAISSLNNRVDGIQNQINDMAKDIDTLNDGVAGAMAMSALPQAFMPETTVIGFGAATFNGSNAIAVGASHKFNENWTGNLKASFGGETGIALGVGYEF